MPKKCKNIKGGATIWARQTLYSSVFFWKPAKWFKIWFFIVNMVNHKDTNLFKRGTNFFTYEMIGQACKSTRGEVEGFIRWARKSTMLSTRKTTRGVIIKVNNYDTFQRLDNYKNDIKTLQKTLQKTPVPSIHNRYTIATINKNEKNERKKENNKRKKKSKSTSSILSKTKHYHKDDLKLAELLKNLILENYPSFRGGENLDVWTEEINKMRRIDKRTSQQIEFIIRWAQQDDFWQAQIHSPQKLRKHFDTLVLRIKSDIKMKGNKTTIGTSKEVQEIINNLNLS